MEAKGCQPALKGQKEIAISGEQKESVQNETPAVSVTMKVNVDKLHVRHLPFQRRRQQRLEKFFGRNAAHKEQPIWKEASEAVQGQPKVNCTNPSCDPRHPPACQNYRTQAGCRFGEQCSFFGSSHFAQAQEAYGNFVLLLCCDWNLVNLL